MESSRIIKNNLRSKQVWLAEFVKETALLSIPSLVCKIVLNTFLSS